jgi:DNA-binding IclR family transcriptional regulator
MHMTNGAMKQVLECLKKAAPKDLSIEEVAAATGIHRNTVSKYVFALEKEGRVMLSRQLGNAKLYTVKEAKA